LKHGISSKIISGTALAVLISLVLMGVFEYYYFTNILKDKAIDDDKIRLGQTEQQFSYIQNDLKTYSRDILIDTQIQDILKIVTIQNDYNYLLTVFEINKRLQQFSSMRNYIHSILIVTQNGSVYGSLESYNNSYIANSLSEGWYQVFLHKKTNHYFSPPHNIKITGIQADVVSYITNIKDLENSNSILGRLIINVNYNYLNKIFVSNGKNSESFWCLSEDNTKIFQNISNQKNVPVPKEVLGKKQLNSTLLSKDNGYYIAKSSPVSKWKFVSFSSYSRLYSRVGKVLYIFIIIIIISFILILTINIPIIHNIIKPLKKLAKAMDIVSAGNLDIKIDISTNDEIEHLYNGFNNMLSQINNFLKSKVEFEKERRQMEFDLLLSQINPHFIYNVLNTVIYMARKEKNTDIVNIIESFINILQKSLTLGSDGLFFTIEKEIAFTKSYIQIQKYRYRNKFKVTWNVAENLNECFIPKTLIQPLVENALYHGICPKSTAGEIIVTVKELGNDISICIEDDGIGMSSDDINTLLYKNDKIIKNGRQHIGIINIRDRIKFLYGENYGLKITSSLEKGTKISVNIPKKTPLLYK
jgi:two-component system, sensor histidine kinase YesM